MPRFKEYTSPDKAFSEDSTGYSAFETAGRRVGPLYNQAGQDYRAAGQAGINAAEAGVRSAQEAVRLADSNTRLSDDQARQQRTSDQQNITNRTWPFDVLALTQQQQAKAKQGGVGVKVEGGVGGGGVGGGGRSHGGGGDRGYSPGRASHAAAGLGQLASGLAQRAPYSGSNDRTGRTDINTGTGQAVRDQPSYTLENGRLVRSDPNRSPTDPNGAARSAADKYGDSIAGQPQDTGLAPGDPVSDVSHDIAADPYGTGGNGPAANGGGGLGFEPPSNEGTPFPADSSGGGWWSPTTSSVASTYSDNSSSGGSGDYGEE